MYRTAEIKYDMANDGASKEIMGTTDSRIDE
jgi:hypothetical protein